jgi:hypothetical protein
MTLFGPNRISKSGPHPTTDKCYAKAWEVTEVNAGMIAFAAMAVRADEPFEQQLTQ